MNRLARAMDQLLVWFILFQMIALTAVVIFAVVARITGNSVSWYDEIAAIQLSWLTYYGGAYAALHRRHIGFDTVLLKISMPVPDGMAAVMPTILSSWSASCANA